MSTEVVRRRRLPVMSPRGQTIVWRIVAVVFVASSVLIAWHNIHEALDHPIEVHLAYSSDVSLPHVTGGTATVRDQTMSGVDAFLTGASAQLQWLIALSIANALVLWTACGLVFGVILARTSSGRPFARTVTNSLTVLSIIVFVFGTMQEILNSWVTLREAYEAVGNLTSSSQYYNPEGFTVSGTAVFIALGIGVLASAFAIGDRLSKDTEGLV